MSRDKKASHIRVNNAIKEEFLEKGYMGATIRGIGKRAGMTSAGLYRHYQNKEAMFAGVVEPLVNEICEWMERHRSRGFQMIESYNDQDMFSGGNADENTGGNAGGNASENTGGNAGGNASENTGENTGGNTGGNAGGNTGENTDGNTGGNAIENTGGNADGHMLFNESFTDMIVEVVLPKKDEFKLLYDCSKGSKFENFIPDFIAENQNAFFKAYSTLKEKGFPVKDIDEAEIRMLISANVSACFLPIIQDYDDEKIEGYMSTLNEFFMPGWKGIFGVD